MQNKDASTLNSTYHKKNPEEKISKMSLYCFENSPPLLHRHISVVMKFQHTAGT